MTIKFYTVGSVQRFIFWKLLVDMLVSIEVNQYPINLFLKQLNHINYKMIKWLKDINV